MWKMVYRFPQAGRSDTVVTIMRLSGRNSVFAKDLGDFYSPSFPEGFGELGRFLFGSGEERSLASAASFMASGSNNERSRRAEIVVCKRTNRSGGLVPCRLDRANAMYLGIMASGRQRWRKPAVDLISRRRIGYVEVSSFQGLSETVCRCQGEAICNESFESTWTDSGSAVVITEKSNCCLWDLDKGTREVFEKMTHHCTCYQGSAIAHPGGIVTPMATSRVCNNPAASLCRVCGGRGTLSDGGLAIDRGSGTGAEDYGYLKLKCLNLNLKEKNVKGINANIRVLKQPRTALTSGVTVRKKRSLMGNLKGGSRKQDIHVLHKEDMPVSDSEKLGVTLLSRHFNDDVTSVPLKKRRYPLAQSISPSQRSLSVEHPESKTPFKVHSALKQDQVKWIEHGQCVQDIMEMTQKLPEGDFGNGNVGTCGNENQIMQKYVEETPASLVSFSDKGVSSADFSGILILATVACTCNKGSIATSLEDVGGSVESLASEGIKSASLSMKNSMEIHRVENQQEVMPLIETCIQEDDCEEQSDMLKSDELQHLEDTKQESKGEQICINLREAVVYSKGNEPSQSTELALESNICRGTSIYIESNDANATGSSVQFPEDREKEEKGMLLRLDSGCSEDKAHWDLNTVMDARENLPENMGSGLYFSGSVNKKNQRYSDKIQDPKSKSATGELEQDMTTVGFHTDPCAHRPDSLGQPLMPEEHADANIQNCIDNANVAVDEMICKFDSAVAVDVIDECKVDAIVTVDKNICKVSGPVTVNKSIYKVDGPLKVGSTYGIDNSVAVDESVCEVDESTPVVDVPVIPNDSIYKVGTLVAVDKSRCQGEAPVIIDDCACEVEASVTIDGSACEVDAPMTVNESTCVVDVPVALNDSVCKVGAPVAVDKSTCQGGAPVIIDDCAYEVEAFVTIDGSAGEVDAPTTVNESTCMVDVPVAVNDSICKIGAPVAVDKSTCQGEAPVIIDDCAGEVEASVTIDGSTCEVEASMAVDDSACQVEASAAVSQTDCSSDARMPVDENVCRLDDAVVVADTCTCIENCESPEDRLAKHSAEMVTEGAYDGDYDYECYDEDDECVSETEQVMEEAADDDSQYEDRKCRETMPCAWVEDVAEELESETEHVDYGYSDCGDADDIGNGTDERFCQSLQAMSVCKGQEPVDSADIEPGVEWADAQQCQVEGVINVCQVLDDSRSATQFGSDRKGNRPSNETDAQGTKLEDAFDNVHHKDDIKSVNLLGENRERVQKVGHPCILDQQEAGSLRLTKNSTSLRQKYSGWDQLPEGFANAKKAVQSVGDNSAMYGSGKGLTGCSSRDTRGQMGSMAARGFLSQMERASPDNLDCGRDRVFRQGGRNQSPVASMRFVSRGLGQHRTIRRGESMHGKGRGGPCMDACNGQWDVIEHHSAGCYDGPVVFGPRGLTNAAAVAAAKVQSSGFVVASDGTIVKAGSMGPAPRWDTCFSSPLRRRSVSHNSRLVRKSPSRSRTHSSWHLARGRTCSRMELESGSRICGKSSPILRSEVRLHRLKSPLSCHISIPGHSSSLLPSSRRYCSPPQASKWSLGTREHAYRRPVVSTKSCPDRMSPPGVHRSSLIHSPGTSKHRVYSRPMYSGRSEFVSDGKHSRHRRDANGRSRQNDCHGALYSMGAVEVEGDRRCFRHEDEDCFQSCNSPAKDAMESQGRKIRRADGKDTDNTAGNISRRVRIREGYNHHFKYKAEGTSWGNFKLASN